MDLSRIGSVPDQKEKIALYKEALAETVKSHDIGKCREFLDSVLSDDVTVVIGRTIMADFAKALPRLDASIAKDVATYSLNKMSVVNFEEPIAAIREQLSVLHEADEEWSVAAKILAGIDLDSGMRVVDDTYKLSKNIKIAMLYLEDDDAVNAETFIKRAAALMPTCTDEVLEMQYKTCSARILDAKRKFLEAAQRYYELSQMGEKVIHGRKVDEEDLIHCLTNAVICVILAPAGPQRARMLSTLYKDERSSKLPQYSVLEKMYLERILRKDEVDAFSGHLKDHHKATNSDGATVLDKAVVQHNLLSASKLYNNISFAELGTVLGVGPQQAELIAADMIAEGRLEGAIDQVDEMIAFDMGSEPLLGWDAVIQGVCESVNGVIEAIAKKGIKI